MKELKHLWGDGVGSVQVGEQEDLPGAEASAEDQVTLSVQPCFHRKLARQAKNKSQVLQLVCFTL